MLFRIARTSPILFFATLALLGSASGRNDTSRLEKRVVGGTAVSNDDVGYVVLLKVPVESGTKYCAGTIIAENFVITSATCLMDDKTLEVKKDMEIEVGYYENEISKLNKVNTKDYYVHDDFSASNGNVVNNIALVETKDGPLTDSKKIAKMVKTTNILPGYGFMTYGWGTNVPKSFDYNGDKMGDRLRFGLVVAGDLDFCKKRIDGFVDHNKSGICVAFNTESLVAICTGDGGVGVYTQDKDYSEALVAISSYTVGEKGGLCGRSDSVTYFTKVYDYADFISKHVEVEFLSPMFG